MKIFIGWPYEEEWVGKYIVPLIQSYGVEAVTGAELQGEKITDGVKEKIARSHRAIFVTTRRQQNGNGTWTTSDWVVDEIKHAASIGKSHIYEVRQRGVEYANRIHDDRQYTIFDDQPAAILAVANVVSAWRGRTYKLRLSPEDFTKCVRQRVPNRSYVCSYAVRRNGQVDIEGKDAEITREGQGFVVWLHDIPNVADAYLDLTVEAGGDRWSCAGLQLGAHDVTMEKL